MLYKIFGVELDLHNFYASRDRPHTWLFVICRTQFLSRLRSAVRPVSCCGMDPRIRQAVRNRGFPSNAINCATLNIEFCTGILFVEFIKEILDRMQASEFDYEAQLFACARGEQAALRSLYEQEAPWLMSVAMRIVCRRELADEVLHDAFLQIWQKSASYSPVLGSARGWIYSVVRHQALNVVRASRHDAPAPDGFIEDVASEDLDPLAALSQKHDSQALHHCLERLDAQKRACLLLAYLDGYSHSQIADHLACPLGTVKSWTRRGLLALKECLS